MAKPHPIVVLTARNADGVVVRQREYTPEEWYDGDVPLIDKVDECKRLSVRTIEGYHTDQTGSIYKRWMITCGAEGRGVDFRE